MGVKSTFFVQVNCDFYNLLSSESRSLIQWKYANAVTKSVFTTPPSATGARVRGERLKVDLDLLSEIAGQRIVKASQHIPSHSADVGLGRAVLNRAYELAIHSGRHALYFRLADEMAWDYSLRAA